MKVLALGGGGGMGRWAARTAANMKEVEQLVVADLNGRAAAEFAGTLGPKARGIALDVTNRDALGDALRGTDAVLNTVGPFYRFGTLVLQAAIRAKCHYLDICDDWEPTLDLLGLDAKAREAGITAVVGMGASPGITNMMAVLALRELDTAEEIYTGWNLEAAVPEPESGQQGVNAALMHGIRQATGTIRVFRDGESREEAPLARLQIDYPGVGRRPVWTFGHPEALTFPRYCPDLKTSLNVTFAATSEMISLQCLRWLVDRRLLSAHRAATIFEWYDKHKKRRANLEFVRKDLLPPLFAASRGTKQGKPSWVGVAQTGFLPSGMGEMTGVPLAIALLLLARGRIVRRGVFAPEGCIDPDAFFEALVPHCGDFAGKPEEVFTITRSWEPDASGRYAALVERLHRG
jgi:saccharopine dehydrogenase-like NADP-dependent oxidoreductase